ncbi:hypothetical protein EPN83_00950 [Patescibacteria group bacterium]|nr:MAG: hypothetical protein EPN83_00950 [Patescibacteria group bacterium]
MMNKNQTIAVVVVLSALVIIALVYWAAVLRKPAGGREAVQDLSSALEQAVGQTSVVAPSANPLDKVTTPVNPIEKTNPFKNEYKNPFE